MTDPSDVIQTYQLRRIQDEAKRANELAEEANHLRRQQLAQSQQAPQVVVQAPTPAPKFDLVGFKARLEKIEAETDPIFLRDLKKLEADLTASCDRHATEITDYIDRTLQDMGERIKARKALWEPLYPAREKEYAEESKVKEEQAIERELAERNDEKIEFLEEYIAMDKAIAIEKNLLSEIKRKPKWADWLIIYVGVTSILPLDVGIIADAIRTFWLESNNPKDGFPIFISLWALKLIVGLTIGFTARARWAKRERTQIQEYLNKRQAAFADRGLPPQFLQVSHNDHVAYMKEVLSHQAKAYGVDSRKSADSALADAQLMKQKLPTL